MKPKINQELQDTLIAHPEVKSVYFDESGRHYLQAHELIAKKGDENTSLYGQGELSHKEVIPGETNYDGLKYDINKGVADTKIVTTMTRKEILDFKVKKDESSLVGMVANMSSEELEALRALLIKSPAAESTLPPPSAKTK